MSTDAERPSAQVRAVRDGAVGELVLGTGVRRNALTRDGWAAIARHVEEFGADEWTRVVIVRGAGDAFCAGADLGEWVGADLDAVEATFRAMEAACQAIERCPVPVLAEVRGAAAGGGCQLALACDLRYAGDSARIGMPIARLGIHCPPPFAARLVALVGPAMARRLLYTGQLLDGPAAVEAGLADEAVPDADLGVRVREVADRIAALPTSAVRAAKQAVDRAIAPVRATAVADAPLAVSSADFWTAVAAYGDRSTGE